MALCKYSQYIGSSSDQAFDQLLAPGSVVPTSGIYRCEGCGEEIAAEARRILPAANHHSHVFNKGAIQWRLVVMTQSKRI